MVDEATTPESFKKGEKFEHYVREQLFISNYYDLVTKTHSYNDNKGDYIESSKHPDFLFRDKWAKKEFYVEVKYRSGFYNDKVEWCKNFDQLKRYQAINRTKPVFLTLGLSGEPSRPEYVFLIPMNDLKYTGLFKSFLKNYEIPRNKPIPSKHLW